MTIWYVKRGPDGKIASSTPALPDGTSPMKGYLHECLDDASDLEIQNYRAMVTAGAPTAAAKLDAHLGAAIAEFSPKQESEPTMTASSPASHALTIKQVLEDHGKKLDQVLQTQLRLLSSELDGQLGTVVTGTDAVIARVRGHTDDFKAILGQFTNDLG